MTLMEMKYITQGEQWKIGTRYICDNNPIGEGKYAVVYKAQDTHLNIPVALKASRSNIEPERLQREAQLMARIRHPSIPRIFDYEVQDVPHLNHAPILIMDYIDGPTLQEVLHGKGELLTSSDAVRIISQVASLIDYLDRENIHHSDLKPSCIFPQKTIVQVVDFTSSEAVGSGRDNYTAEYAAPERVVGERTLATEEFSLAAIAYTIVSGGTSQLISTSQESSIPKVKYHSINELNTRYKLSKAKMHELNDVFKKALAQEPEKRYTSATEFAQTFARIMEGVEPISHIRDNLLHHMLS